MKKNIVRIISILVVTYAFIISSICYATITSEEKEIKCNPPGEKPKTIGYRNTNPQAKFSFIPRGIEEVRSGEIATSRENGHELLPLITVLAKCMSGKWVSMFPADNKILNCPPGDSILITMEEPTNQNPETWVFHGTLIKDDGIPEINVEQNIEGGKQLNAELAQNIKTNIQLNTVLTQFGSSSGSGK